MVGEDPNNPTQSTEPVNTTQQVANTQAVTIAVNESNQAISKYNELLTAAQGAFSYFQQRADAAGVSLSKNSQLTAEQTSAFGKLSVELVGARKAFDGLNGIDTSSVHGFMDQWSSLSSIIQQAPISNQLGMLKDVLTSLGAPVNDIAGAMKKGLQATMNYAQAFFTSADNGARLQNAMVQLAAKTGDLGNVTRAAGPHLNNLNLLLASQQKIVDDTAKAMNEDQKTVEQYYTALGNIPKALEQNVKGTDEVNGSVSMLTATMQYAKGSGRAFQDVVTDLKTAFHDYNLQGEDALKFTARMSELSNKFGVELSDVQGSLKGTADMFKMFGKEAEGAAKMVNSYLGELQQTGISGRVALDVIGGLTQGIKGMSLAQKGFLSAQTGGPGGLMGGFQIEKMLRDGKIDEVMDKVRQQMSKQFGKIATLDDAQSSPQAAAQLTKQMMILQQGPLGRFAKDDQSAMRILEAFKTREQGGPTSDLSKSIVQDTMQTGVDLQDKTNTILSQILVTMQRAQSQASLSNYSDFQDAMTAGTGREMDFDPNGKMRDNIRQSNIGAARNSGINASQAAQFKKTGILTDQSGEFTADIVRDTKNLFQNELGPAIKGPIAKITQMLKSGDQTGAQRSVQAFNQDIENKKKELVNLPKEQREEMAKKLEEQKNAMNSYYNEAVTASKGPQTPVMELDAPNGSIRNIRSTANRVASTRAAQTTEAAQAVQSNTSASNGAITVQVEGFCLNCGTKMRNNSHRIAVAPGTRAGEDH